MVPLVAVRSQPGPSHKSGLAVVFLCSPRAGVRNPLVAVMVLARQADAKRQYEQLLPRLQSRFPDMFVAGAHSLETWKWSVAQVLSRSFKVVVEADTAPVFTMVPLVDATKCVVPAAVWGSAGVAGALWRPPFSLTSRCAVDLPSHAHSAENNYVVRANAFRVFTSTACLSGAQFAITYGHWSSRQLMLSCESWASPGGGSAVFVAAPRCCCSSVCVAPLTQPHTIHNLVPPTRRRRRGVFLRRLRIAKQPQ